MPRKRRFAGLLAVVVCSSFLFAQDLESFAGLRFRFDAPGARAAAMGGASEALTDVVSVATNPASLAGQKNRAAAIEARHVSSDTEYVPSASRPASTTR